MQLSKPNKSLFSSEPKSEFKFKTGRFYDDYQELHCFVIGESDGLLGDTEYKVAFFDDSRNIDGVLYVTSLNHSEILGEYDSGRYFELSLEVRRMLGDLRSK